VLRPFLGRTIAAVPGVFAISLAIAVLIPVASAFGQAPTFETLAAPGPLSEQALGRADAPVTLFEYGNFTCRTCVDFNAKVLPALKSRYVDGGRLRFVFREIVWLKDPGGNLNAAAFMLARCAGDARYFPVLDALNQQVDKWLYGEPIPGLTAIASQFGMTRDQLNTCLSDQKLLADVVWHGDRLNTFHLSYIPAFFVADSRSRKVTVLMQGAGQAELLDLAGWERALKPWVGP